MGARGCACPSGTCHREAECYCPSERRLPAEETVCRPAWPAGQAPAPSLQCCPVQPQPARCPAVQQPELQPGLPAVPAAAAVCSSTAAAVCPSAAVCSPAAAVCSSAGTAVCPSAAAAVCSS